MAQYSYRYQPQFKMGEWIRIEVSWREDGTAASSHHFIDEWTGSIPQQPADEYTWYTFDKLSLNAMERKGFILADRCDFEFAHDATIFSCLDDANESAEIRISWSPDNSTWTPLFWGIIDLDDVDPKCMRIVNGTWIRTVKFTAYDALEKANRVEPFPSIVTSNLTPYIEDISGTGKVYLGAEDLRTLLVYRDYSWSGGALIPNTEIYAHPDTDEAVQVIGYMLEAPRALFAERNYQTHSTAKAGFGWSAVTPDVELRAYTTNAAPWGTPTYHNVNDWFIFHDMFSTEFADDFDSFGEFIKMLCHATRTCAVTWHNINGTGQWERSLLYVPTQGDSGNTLTFHGVMTDHGGGRRVRDQRNVVVTTRYYTGAFPMRNRLSAVQQYGGQNEKIGTHFRTLDNGSPDDYSAIQSEEYWMHKVVNTFWQCLLVRTSVSPLRLQVANGARIGTYTSGGEKDAWTFRNYNDFALVLATGYASNEYSKGRLVCTEERSRMKATSSYLSTTNPLNAKPLSKCTDPLHSGTFTVLGVEMNPDTSRLTITKERAA